MMASLNRGQPPAWHTKAVHHRPGCLKAGSTMGMGEVLDCDNDDMPSKPNPGRGITDATQSIYVNKCGGNRCKTCEHIVEDNSFTIL